ncbi:MAG: deoxynucleoside kinase, partial [Niameybacter sp.]
MLIVVGGMIGLGKSSVAEVLGEALGSEVFFESVDDNPILPLFYTASPEEIQSKRYPFLLQLYFLDTRFKAIKQALVKDNNVLDRSIYEDWYFAKKNMELGRINKLEMQVYESLLHNMMEELEELPKKAPDLMVY